MKAVLLAESTLDRVGHDIALAEGGSGSTGDGFAWQVQSTPYSVEPDAAAGPLIGYLVRVTVHWKERKNAREVQLTTLRLVPREPGS